MRRLSFRALAPLILAGLVAVPPSPAISGDKGVAELSYSAYYGGLSAVDVDARITITDGRYALSTEGKSVGFLDFLFPFMSNAAGSGELQGNTTPRKFALTSTFRGRSRKIEGTSIADTVPDWTVIPPIPTDERDPVPENLRTGTQDPIAALVSAATSKAARDVCSGTSRIFNGKVRTDVHLTHLGHESLKPNRFSSFAGPAEKCEARYETLAGGYKKSWFASDGPPPVIQFWITPIADLGFWIPVRVEASTDLAKVLIHLTGATTGPAGSTKQP
jgi:hypothetical protein